MLRSDLFVPCGGPAAEGRTGDLRQFSDYHYMKVQTPVQVLFFACSLPFFIFRVDYTVMQQFVQWGMHLIVTSESQIILSFDLFFPAVGETGFAFALLAAFWSLPVHLSAFCWPFAGRSLCACFLFAFSLLAAC